jgi:hypothetical protein
MNRRLIAVLAAAALTLVAALAAVGPVSAATVRHIEGRVLSVDRDARSFRLRDSERGTFTVFVVRSTRFERTSFARLRSGSGVEATIRRANGRWQATKVEPNSGSHADDGGDDNGGGRGGNDDGPNHS